MPNRCAIRFVRRASENATQNAADPNPGEYAPRFPWIEDVSRQQPELRGGDRAEKTGPDIQHVKPGRESLLNPSQKTSEIRYGDQRCVRMSRCKPNLWTALE